MSGARERILGRVRAALGRSSALAPSQAQRLQTYMTERAAGPRPRIDTGRLQRFRERALVASSTLDEVESWSSVPAAVARFLAQAGLPPAAVVWPEFARLDWLGAGIAVQARRAQDGDAVGITGCFCALAETGTLLQLSAAGRPASTSLLPPTHVALVPAQRVLSAMEDAWSLLRAELGALPRAANFISGPSRTADIEQTLVLGAHGPCRVHIVVVHD